MWLDPRPQHPPRVRYHVRSLGRGCPALSNFHRHPGVRGVQAHHSHNQVVTKDGRDEAEAGITGIQFRL